MSFTEQVGMDRDGGGSEVLRRNPCMPESIIRTTLPLTPASVPLCPLPSPHDRWVTYGKKTGGYWEPLVILAQWIIMQQRRDSVRGPSSALGLFSHNR